MLCRIYNKGLGTVHAGGTNKATLKDRDIFDKKEDTGGIILLYNRSEHCFVLRGLVPTKFF